MIIINTSNLFQPLISIQCYLCMFLQSYTSQGNLYSYQVVQHYIFLIGYFVTYTLTTLHSIGNIFCCGQHYGMENIVV